MSFTIIKSPKESYCSFGAVNTDKRDRLAGPNSQRAPKFSLLTYSKPILEQIGVCQDLDSRLVVYHLRFPLPHIHHSYTALSSEVDCHNPQLFLLLSFSNRFLLTSIESIIFTLQRSAMSSRAAFQLRFSIIAHKRFNKNWIADNCQ